MGGRAGKALDALKDAGFLNLQLYQGSYNDWTAQGGQVMQGTRDGKFLI